MDQRPENFSIVLTSSLRVNLPGIATIKTVPDNVADDGFEAVVQLDEGFARVAETNEEEGRLGGQVVREPGQEI